MAKIEFQMITRRRIPVDLIETFDLQTNRDYSMKILTRVDQPWRVEDLNIDFPLEVIPQRLFYSTGTRYGLCLARNELLSYAEADYILVLDDFIIISPWTVEMVMSHLQPDFVVRGFKVRAAKKWLGRQQYDAFFSQSNLMRLGHNLWDTTPRRRKRKPAKIMPEHFTTAYDLIPMGLLKKVNGWDMKYDGGWGLDDYDLGNRLKYAGAWFSRIGKIICFLLNHDSHTVERDDKSLGIKGCHIYNKKTGKKMNFQYLDHDTRQKYYQSQLKNQATRAPIGLKEVSDLLK